MKKSLWIINQYAGSPYHGMNFRSYYFASELTERGYHVEIISGSYSHLMTAPPEVEGVFTREEVDGIGYNWIRLPRYKNSQSIMRFVTMLIFLWRLFFFRSEKLIRPDVILVSSISPFPILWAYLKARRFGAKLVFEVRDIWPMTLQYLGKYSRFHPIIIILQWLENFAYKHCDYAVALLPKADEHMYEHGLKKGRFRYIPNGIRIEDFKKPIPLQEDILAKIPKQKFIVGYVGTIGIANALNFLLDAAASLQENSMIHFIVVGQGGSKQELMDRVSHEGLQNVSFLIPYQSFKFHQCSRNVMCCTLAGMMSRSCIDLVYLRTSCLNICMRLNRLYTPFMPGMTLYPKPEQA